MNTYHKWLIVSVLATCSFFSFLGIPKSSKSISVNSNLMKQESTSKWNRDNTEKSTISDAVYLQAKPDNLIESNSVKKFTNISATVPDSTPLVDKGQFVLTAYALDKTCTGKSPEMPGFGITASGTRAKVGVTVAVDPKVISYGSLIFISGIGWRIAEDTGEAIKGHHIDVLVNSYDEAVRFGVKQHRHVKIYQPDTKEKKSSTTPREVSLINMQK